MNQHNVLVTGASGFVGQQVVDTLSRLDRVRVFAGTRREGLEFTAGVTPLVMGDLDGEQTALSLTGISEVIHCAARVHVMNDSSADPLAAFRAVNVDGTLRLAQLAARAGVKRFIFVSSIKVNGESTRPGNAFTADSVPAAIDPYGISKLEAEQRLFELAAQTGMEITIVRPVLVYGPGVKANFQSMMKWLNKSLPLPLGGIRNKRSMVALDNLVDLLVTCIDHPAAANEVFLASDGEDLSTPELLRRTARALDKRAVLLPVPGQLLKAAAIMFGKSAVADRLCGSLQVDISKNRQLLGWVPPVGIDQALRKTARHFLEHHKA